ATFGTVGLVATVGLGIAAQKLLNLEPSFTLPGIVALIGALVCFVLLRGNRVQASLANFVATCLLMTATAMTYTALRISPLADGPNVAKAISSLIPAQSRTLRVATYRYSAPSLVYYLHHPIERIDTDDIETFFDRGDILVMPREAYDRERERLPADVKVLA